MIDRRAFARIVAVGLIIPLVARGQSAAAVRRIGVLHPGSRSQLNEADIQTAVATLNELGWVEGRNIVFERRFGRRESHATALVGR